jgi:ABC-type branched-subunit amino acid transport system substrate-binding protein
VGQERLELRGDRQSDQGVRSGRRLPGRHRLQQRRQADQGPDGWTPISATIQGAGQASEGMYITQPGLPADQLKGEGKKFSDEFTAEIGKSPNPYTAYAAQAATILLDAIADSDGSRASVSEGLFNRDIKGGILGDFKIDENGDTTLGIVSVYQIKNQKETFVKTITPKLSFVKG